jgi:hypothetical protein
LFVPVTEIILAISSGDDFPEYDRRFADQAIFRVESEYHYDPFHDLL